MNPVELFQSGQLAEAVAAATEAVRSRPSDIRARSLLCELLCFSGDLVRADKQLDAALQIDPGAMVGISLLRHLIRSEISRREVFHEGRVPDFLTAPTPSQQLRLQAILNLRNGGQAEALQCIQQAVELEQPVGGEVDGVSFAEFRDLDDLLGPTLEIYTATGKYFWLDCSQIVMLEFGTVEHLSDMLWRAATIETTGDVSGRVHIPALYEGSHDSADQRVRIGRTTEWNQVGTAGPVLGGGQREFLAGDEVIPILQIRRLAFRAEKSGQTVS